MAAASGEEKLELCRERGAEACVDYDRENLRDRIKEITGKAGAQIVDLSNVERLAGLAGDRIDKMILARIEGMTLHPVELIIA